VGSPEINLDYRTFRKFIQLRICYLWTQSIFAICGPNFCRHKTSAKYHFFAFILTVLWGKICGFAVSGLAHLRILQICDCGNEPKNLRICDLRGKKKFCLRTFVSSVFNILDYLLNHGLLTVRWGPQCGPERVPDQPRAISQVGGPSVTLSGRTIPKIVKSQFIY
jgi:hypothetical protein